MACYYATVEYQYINVQVPRPLYERLRAEAFETRTSQAKIVTAMLAERYGQEDAGEVRDGSGSAA